MDSFVIYHEAYEELNTVLQGSVGTMRGILDELETWLRGMGSATGGVATPLWEGRKNNWNFQYTDMIEKLGLSAVASSDVGDIWKRGDGQSAAIMLR
jgi:hypothetical protein